jgi:Fe2+ transport system protein FeoA
MRCPLCSYEFEPTAMNCHSSCAFNESCGIICCPTCGYQMPDERKSPLAAMLRRILARRQKQPLTEERIRPLSSIQPGQSAKVVTIQSSNHARVERLHILGLADGASVTLEQNRPTFVLRAGFTELSLEREIADEILVEVID